MEFFPDLPTFCRLAKKGNLIPIYSEFLADLLTPVAAMERLSPKEYGFLLESVEGQEKWARYSFLGVNPSLILSCKGQEVTIQRGAKVKRQKVAGNPLAQLQKLLAAYQPVAVKGVPRFHGGAVGYVGYDAVRYFEKLPEKSRRVEDLPDALFLLTDTLVVFDNVRHRIQIIANASVPKNAKQEALKKVYRTACEQIQTLTRRITGTRVGGQWRGKRSRTAAPQEGLSKKAYMERVKRAKRLIYEGDIVQVVLSNRFSGTTSEQPFQIYRALRSLNPSPYLFYLKLKDFHLVGSSPETLVRLEEGAITVRPIAGTRPRGKDEEEDARLRDELLNDPKEKAEHVMLVDLGRNDVGRVAKGGTVQVTDFMKVEAYSHVMHLVSNVQAKLAGGLDAFDLLTATFPAGTLTGAPKVRAMEIIEDLEPTRRGPYGGAVGYFSYSGNMDFCITIRTLVLTPGRYAVQAGAGIVADSQPELEYQECKNKARALLKALDLAREISDG